MKNLYGFFFGGLQAGFEQFVLPEVMDKKLIHNQLYIHS